MKIAIAAQEPSLDAPVDVRLGRTAYFLIGEADAPEKNWKPHRNSTAASGAGVAAAQFLADAGVKAVIAGNIGPTAAQVFNAAGIKVYVATHMTAGQAAKAFGRGDLAEVATPTVQAHSGMAKTAAVPPANTRLGIATEGAQVAQHFGRCQEYTLVDISAGRETRRSVVPSPGHAPGALPVFMAEKGVKLVIAGGMGPKAADLFAEHGIKTIVGVGGSIDEAIQLYLTGKLASGQSMCEH